jgi:hypothetical protein
MGSGVLGETKGRQGLALVACEVPVVFASWLVAVCCIKAGHRRPPTTRPCQLRSTGIRIRNGRCPPFTFTDRNAPEKRYGPATTPFISRKRFACALELRIDWYPHTIRSVFLACGARLARMDLFGGRGAGRDVPPPQLLRRSCCVAFIARCLRRSLLLLGRIGCRGGIVALTPSPPPALCPPPLLWMPLPPPALLGFRRVRRPWRRSPIGSSASWMGRSSRSFRWLALLDMAEPLCCSRCSRSLRLFLNTPVGRMGTLFIRLLLTPAPLYLYR